MFAKVEPVQSNDFLCFLTCDRLYCRSGRPARDDGKPITTLAVSFMMALKSGCIKPSDSSYWVCNWFSRALFILGYFVCVFVSVATLADMRYYDPSHMDWFGWTSWATVAVSEALFLAMNVAGRCQQFTNDQFKETGCTECLASMIRRVPFGAGWQAMVISMLNAAGSVAFLFGLLVIHMQMMLDTDQETVRVANEGIRDIWTQLWTCLYAFVCLGLIWASLLDPTRLGDRVGDLQKISTWSVEFEAWRVLFLGIIMPIIAFAFCFYCNLCCEGRWEY